MKVIDLTHPLHVGMIKFHAPWHAETDIRTLGTIENAGRNTSVITIGSHSGTHVDAERHFVEDGETIDRVPLDKLVGSVRVIDFSFKNKGDFVTKKDFSRVEITERMLFYFNWGRYWNTGQFYKEYPYFSEEAAQYLVDKGAKVIGMDTPSPDDSATVLGSGDDSKIHKLFLKQGVTLIEYLANLDQCVNSFEKCVLCALPLPISGGDGSPVRACLIVCED